MEEWKEYKLGDLIVSSSGGTPNKSNSSYWDGDIPWISAKAMYDDYLYSSDMTITREGLNNGSRLAPVNSILLLTRGSGLFNRIPVCLVKRAMAFNQDVKCIESRNQDVVSNLFLFYWFIGNKQEISNILETTGIGAGKIDTERLKNISIKLPPIKTQQVLIKFAESLMLNIEVNRRINDNLEQQAQALFKSWFVDFEPFKDGEFVESELGMIPKGWRVYSMDELVEIIGGYSYKGNELQESTTAMATIKNFERSGGFKINGFKEIVPSSKAKQEQFLKKFDIIIAHTDLTQNADIIGNPALILHFGGYDRLIMSMDLVKVKSKNDYITYGLLYSIFADVRFKSHALGYVNGTTVLHLSKKAIPEYKLALPHDLSILANYCKTFDSIFAKEAAMMEETERLAELRDTLLPKLMSGELKVNK